MDNIVAVDEPLGILSLVKKCEKDVWCISFMHAKSSRPRPDEFRCRMSLMSTSMPTCILSIHRINVNCAAEQAYLSFLSYATVHDNGHKPSDINAAMTPTTRRFAMYYDLRVLPIRKPKRFK